MPKGKPLANLMDNEVVEVMYTCIKHAQNNIDFESVAMELGLKNATAAKDRLARVMKAQQKGDGTAIAAPPTTTAKARKTAGVKRVRKAKEADGGKHNSDGNDSESSNKKPKLEEGHIANGDTEVTEKLDAAVEDVGEAREKSNEAAEGPVDSA